MFESEDNHLKIEGVIDLFEGIKYDSVEIVAVSNTVDDKKIFNCEYKEKKSQIYFKVKMNLLKEKKYLNTIHYGI
ncbi:MAG: hypothetical protein PHY59_02230 [Methanobacterium sp.]|nr:hypothetical protein [Methanobacterium sp.]